MTKKIDLERETVFAYLLNLRDSGVTNMFGAVPYLQREFAFTREVASEWLGEWMDSFKSEDEDGN